MTSGTSLQDRMELLRASRVAVSDADEIRVLQSVRASLAALDAAAIASLFDTEPATFDVVVRKLAKAHRHD
jgi:hypothetical protein